MLEKLTTFRDRNDVSKKPQYQDAETFIRNNLKTTGPMDKFDTSEHERYVSRQVGQFLDEDAGMLNLRAEVKTRIPTTGQITPIFKLGCGYYFMDSNSSYRSGNEFHPYDFFQDNWGVNAGVELMLKTTNGPRFYISADFINVFDVVRTSYNEDDLTMIKLGIGVTFINP